MNYEVHLNTVFTTPELAEEFMKELMEQLNDITFNGANKIDKVSAYAGSAIVRTPEFKSGRAINHKCEQAHYYFSPRKAGKVTLD